MHGWENLGWKYRLLYKVRVACDRIRDGQERFVKEEPWHQPADKPEDEGRIGRALSPESDRKNKVENNHNSQGMGERPKGSRHCAGISAFQITQSQRENHRAVTEDIA
jgi:hypothetical protein